MGESLGGRLGGKDVRISRTCTHGEVDPDIYMMGNNGRFAGWEIFGQAIHPRIQPPRE